MLGVGNDVGRSTGSHGRNLGAVSAVTCVQRDLTLLRGGPSEVFVLEL